MKQDRYLADVRRQLDELRRRIGCQKGDELDRALVAVEALAITMAAMSTDTAALIADGERNVGSIISAALTKKVLWRAVVLPAIVAALVSVTIVGLSTTIQSIVAERVIEADHIALAEKAKADRATDDRRFELLRADLDKDRAEVEAERRRIESTLPGNLLQRAETLTAAARDIVRQEAATPGLVDFIASQGVAAMRAARLNGGSLCPKVVYAGTVPFCQYRAE